MRDCDVLWEYLSKAECGAYLLRGFGVSMAKGRWISSNLSISSRA